MKKDTKFKPGKSGNPDGRKKGSTDKRTKYRELFGAMSEQLVNKTIELALAGDTTCLKMCIDRIVSPFRASDSVVNVDNFEGTIEEQGAEVIKLMGQGELTPSDAAAMLSALSAQSKIKEFCELEERVNKLEENNEFKK